MKFDLSKLPHGAVLWSGKTFSGLRNSTVIYKPEATGHSRCEVKALPYLEALGLKLRAGHRYPIPFVDVLLDVNKPLHPDVAFFYGHIDNPDNETAFSKLRSLSELEGVL